MTPREIDDIATDLEDQAEWLLTGSTANDDTASQILDSLARVLRKFAQRRRE